MLNYIWIFLGPIVRLYCTDAIMWRCNWFGLAEYFGFLQLSLQPKIHVWSMTWVMWPSIFSVFSKIARQKTTKQPWWPLLPSYYYATTSNRDMAGGERRHQQPYYAIMIDDMLPSSWLAHKTTSNIVHHLMTWKYSSKNQSKIWKQTTWRRSQNIWNPKARPNQL